MKDTAPSVSEQPPIEEHEEDCEGEEDTIITRLCIGTIYNGGHIVFALTFYL